MAASSTLSEVHRRLGLRAGGYDSMRAHIARLGLDAAHIPRAVAGDTRVRRNWTDEDLRRAVADAVSVHDVLRRLGRTPSGGMFRSIVAHIHRLDLDTGHFTGRSWARGRTFPGRATRALSEVLRTGTWSGSSASLRRRLIAAGLKPPRCEECGLSEWRGRPLPLHLDHVNGDHTDNRLENLRILCPNCHSLTGTWCRRKARPAYSNRQRDGA